MQQLIEIELEDIPRDECANLLASHRFGRLAVDLDDGPTIFPVNYVFDDPSILIRTSEGTKLASAPMAVAAFEIDGIGSGGEWGWSVVVRGRAHDITETLDEYSEQLRELSVYTWAPGRKDRLLRVTASELTGRRYGAR